MQFVTTQNELDAALVKYPGEGICIDSPADVWLTVTGSVEVYAFGLSSVDACDTATVRTYDSASAHAHDSSVTILNFN